MKNSIPVIGLSLAAFVVAAPYFQSSLATAPKQQNGPIKQNRASQPTTKHPKFIKGAPKFAAQVVKSYVSASQGTPKADRPLQDGFTVTALHGGAYTQPPSPPVPTDQPIPWAATQREKQTPTIITVTQTPDAETVTQTPDAETVTHTPDAVTVTQTTDAETVTHTPDAVTVTQTPVASTSSQSTQSIQWVTTTQSVMHIEAMVADIPAYVSLIDESGSVIAERNLPAAEPELPIHHHSSDIAARDLNIMDPEELALEKGESLDSLREEAGEKLILVDDIVGS